MIHFSWDNNKNNSNKAKHGIDFSEARSVFFDENARLIVDPDHSIDEERFILLGLSIKAKILTVVHCYKENDDTIRLISARKANKKEAKTYEEFFKMRKDYDFKKSVKNPYSKKLKKAISIRLDESSIDYFKEMATETGIPYQNLINLYLRDCAENHKKLKIKWAS